MSIFTGHLLKLSSQTVNPTDSRICGTQNQRNAPESVRWYPNVGLSLVQRDDKFLLSGTVDSRVQPGICLPIGHRAKYGIVVWPNAFYRFIAMWSYYRIVVYPPPPVPTGGSTQTSCEIGGGACNATNPGGINSTLYTFPVWAHYTVASQKQTAQALYTLTIIENPSIVAAALPVTEAQNYYDYTPKEVLPGGDSAVSLRPTSRYGWTYYASLPVEAGAGNPMAGSRDEHIHRTRAKSR